MRFAILGLASVGLLLGLQQATYHVVPVSTLVLLVPVALLILLLTAVPLTVALSVLIDRRLPRRGRSARDESRRQAFKPLHFTTEAAWSVVQLRSLWESSPDGHPLPKRPLHPAMPEVLVGPLDDVFSKIMRDFVLSWFTRVSPSPTFPAELEMTIREALGVIVGRLETTDVSTLLVRKIIPHLTAHLDSFSNAEQTLSGSRRQSTILGGPGAEGLDVFLVQAYGPNKLHEAIAGKALDSRPAQEAHLRKLVEGILAIVLPERNRSPVVQIIAREIVTCTILMPVVEMLSDPDFWNRLLDDQATKHIREQKLIHQLRAALDTTVPPSLPTSLASTAHKGRTVSISSSRRGISSKTNSKAFDVFLKSIARLETVQDGRRMKSDVEREIRRTKEALGSNAGSEGGGAGKGETPGDLRSHLERLVLAHGKVERRIAKLGGADSQPVSKLSSTATSSGLNSATLLSILANPSSLSYFMEFMERRSSLILVQFWLMIESFRIPLEDLDAEVDEDETDEVALGDEEKERVVMAREDLLLVWESYFEEDVLGLGIAEKFGSAIERFLKGQGRRGMQDARRSMFNAQKHVYRLINEDFFPAFKSSDLYFKAAADVPSTISVPAIAIPSTHRTPTPQPPVFPHRNTTSDLSGAPLLASPALRKSGSAASSLELHGKVAPYSAPLAPTVSFGVVSLDSDPGQNSPHDRGRQSSPAPPLEPPLLSPPLKSPRFKNSHFEFLVSGDTKDATEDRPPLFVEPDEDEYASDDEDYIQVQRMDAIQAALTDIIAKDQSITLPPPALRRKSTQKTAGRRLPSDASMARSLDSLLENAPDPNPPSPDEDGARPLLMGSSVSDLHASKRNSKRVFDDDDDDDGLATPSLLSSLMDTQAETHDSRDLTSVGIMQLPTEISRVAGRIAKLRDQEGILDALIRKAELVGNKRELALLNNSHQSLVREVRALAFQKRQWEQQEMDSRLYPGRTKVSIPSSTNITEDGKPITRYLVEIQQLGEDGAFAHGWVVARRYNEFFTLHHDLREKLASVRHLALPGKMLVTSMSSSFVDGRRSGLEKYLQSLITIPDACASLELRAFLAQTSSSPDSEGPVKSGASLPRPQDLVKSLFRTVTSGLDDIGAPTGGIESAFDLLSQGLTKQAGDLASLAGFAPDTSDESVGQGPSQESSSPALSDLMGLKPMDGETAASYFTAPICDLFVEVFELKENNWFRRQAIVVILQQILGGTIERKLRDVVDRLSGPTSVLSYLTTFSNSLWPNGVRRPPSIPRTEEQKRQTKEDVAKKLPSLIPDIASNMIGRGNTRRGAKRLFAVLQHQKLNQSLVHAIVDEVIFAIFPELAQTTIGD